MKPIIKIEEKHDDYTIKALVFDENILQRDDKKIRLYSKIEIKDSKEVKKEFFYESKLTEEECKQIIEEVKKHIKQIY